MKKMKVMMIVDRSELKKPRRKVGLSLLKGRANSIISQIP